MFVERDGRRKGIEPFPIAVPFVLPACAVSLLWRFVYRLTERIADIWKRWDTGVANMLLGMPSCLRDIRDRGGGEKYDETEKDCDQGEDQE